MQVLKKEMQKMETCIDFLVQYVDFNKLPQWLQDTVIDCDVARMDVYKRLKKMNRRTADYVAEKRLTDKNYGRTKK